MGNETRVGVKSCDMKSEQDGTLEKGGFEGDRAASQNANPSRTSQFLMLAIAKIDYYVAGVEDRVFSFQL